MSTYVYISRRLDPFDDHGPQISANEWERWAESQSDFRHPFGDESKWSGAHARVWTGYEYPIVFDWNEGQLDVKNPDAKILMRMNVIAMQLSAIVFSENGELFDEYGKHAGFLDGFP